MAAKKTTKKKLRKAKKLSTVKPLAETTLWKK